MLKAVLQKGVIVPLDPVPLDWKEGDVLEIDRAEAPEFDIDEWAAAMNELCADSTPEDEEALQHAIDEQRRESKVRIRREMGLPE